MMVRVPFCAECGTELTDAADQDYGLCLDCEADLGDEDKDDDD